MALHRIQHDVFYTLLHTHPPPPPPLLRLRATDTINNSDLSSLSQTACHWSLQLSWARLTLQRYWPESFLLTTVCNKNQCPSSCAKWCSVLWKCVWCTNPYLRLAPFDWITGFSLEASFHLMRLCTVRDLTVCCSSLCTHLWIEDRQDKLSYCYLIFFSLVNVLHNVMRRFSREWSEWIIHPHGRLGWTRIRISNRDKLWEEWAEEKMEKWNGKETENRKQKNGKQKRREGVSEWRNEGTKGKGGGVYCRKERVVVLGQ